VKIGPIEFTDQELEIIALEFWGYYPKDLKRENVVEFLKAAKKDALDILQDAQRLRSWQDWSRRRTGR